MGVFSPDLNKDHSWFKKQQSQNYDLFGTWLTPRLELDTNKPTLFLVNGWMGTHKDNLQYIDFFEGKFDIFGLDNRGSGKSTLEGDLDVVQFALDLNYVLLGALDEKFGKKAVESGTVILQASCAGTLPVAVMYADKFPITKFITHLVLISPESKVYVKSSIKIFYYTPVWLAKIIRKGLLPLILNILFFGKKRADARRVTRERLDSLDLHVAQRQVKQFLKKADVSELWESITVPTLILIGQNDKVVPPRLSKEVASQIPNSSLLELTAPDHLLVEYNVGFVRKAYLELLEK